MSEPAKQNYLHGAAILTAGVVIMKILGAIYKIPLQNILGDTGYGYFNAAYVIYNVLLTISTAGFPVALSRLIAEANTLGRPLQARRTFGVASWLLFALGFVLSALMLIFPTGMAELLVSQPEISLCVSALAPAVLLVCLTSAFRGYIQGYGNMKPTTVGQVLEVLVKVVFGLALAIYLTRLGKDLPSRTAGAILGVTAGALAALLYMLACYIKGYRKTSLTAVSENRETPDSVGSTLGRFLKIGIAITLGASVMSIISLIDTKLINMQLPYVEGIGPEMSKVLYGCYSAMQTLFNLPAAFITPMVIAVVPAISAAVSAGNDKEVGFVTEGSLRISSVVAMPMGVGLSVLSLPIVHILYPETHAIGPVILAYLGVASFFVCIGLVTNAILQANGNEKLPIISMVAGGAVKIAFNLLLVGRPEINILGAPIGTIACYIVICAMNCVFIRRKMKYPPQYSRVFLRPLAGSAVMGAAALGSYSLLSRLLGGGLSRMTDTLVLCAAILIAVLVYTVLTVLTRAVTLEDMKLIPKGEKLARLLHIRQQKRPL